MEVRSGWTTSWNETVPSLQNVMPEWDIIEHEPSLRCQCQPHYERIVSGPHVMGRVIVHRKLVD
jgi:hypothetical protein